MRSVIISVITVKKICRLVNNSLCNDWHFPTQPWLFNKFDFFTISLMDWYPPCAGVKRRWISHKRCIQVIHQKMDLFNRKSLNLIPGRRHCLISWEKNKKTKKCELLVNQLNRDKDKNSLLRMWRWVDWIIRCIGRNARQVLAGDGTNSRLWNAVDNADAFWPVASVSIRRGRQY